MNWNAKFARRTELMKRTAVRELLKVASQPDIISFAGGLPAAELFPLGRVESAMREVLARQGAQALQYGETEGVAELRSWLARRFSNRTTLRIAPENVLITSGAQQALDLIGRIFLEEGDCVAVENPTYLALLSAWRPQGAEFLAVPSDAKGMQVNYLESGTDRVPKLVYCVPNFQNPQGTSLSLERRKELVRLSRARSMPVVEDDPYGELRYDNQPLPSMLSMSGAGVESTILYTGTFSKVLMPGLRVGWVIAARPVIEKLVQAKQAADLHTSTLCQHLALELVKQGFLEEFLPVARRVYGERRDLILQALDRHFPGGTSWTRPEGGMFLMATLPAQINAAELLPAALARKVAYVPGEEFHLEGSGRNTLRLNFSNARPDQIERGIRLLGEMVAEAGQARPRPPKGAAVTFAT